MKSKKPYFAVLVAVALSGTAQAAEKNSPANNQATITTVYTRAGDISPKSFTVTAGQKVRFQVNPQDTGTGCMKDIMIQGLWNKPEPLVKGRPVVMEFVPQKPGTYNISCAMGVKRGIITVR
ncbi:MAG TPA: cupredoxin domain-containing protein [Chlorobaculum sp.]|nr:cupredoxin domain-containing protein [Chlorobaculum sp.]